MNSFGPEVAWLQFVSPRCIHPDWPVIARTDAPFPVIVLGDVSARPTNEPRVQSRYALFNVVADTSFGVAGHQRNLVDPQFSVAGKENGNFCQRIGLRRFQSEAILSPITSDLSERSAGILFASGLIGFQRYSNVSSVIRTFQPDIPAVLESCSGWESIPDEYRVAVPPSP